MHAHGVGAAALYRPGRAAGPAAEQDEVGSRDAWGAHRCRRLRGYWRVLCAKFITAKPRFCRPSQRPVGAAVRGPGLLGVLGRGGSGVRGGPDRAAAAMAAPGPTARLADLTENALFPRAAPPKRPVARSFWAPRRLPGALPLPARLGRGRRPRVGLQEAPKVAEIQTLTKARLGARRPPSDRHQRVYSSPRAGRGRVSVGQSASRN